MKKSVFLLFSNLENPKDQFQVEIEVFSTSLAKRWFSALWELVRRRYSINKNFMFLGFPFSSPDIDFWLKKHNAVVRDLRSYLRDRSSPIEKRVYNLLRPLTGNELFKEFAYQPKHLFRNHHAFELGMGQSWDTSPLCLNAPVRIRFRLRELNEFIHQIEWKCRGLNDYALAPELLSPFFQYCTHFGAKEQFQAKDYEYFDLNSGFGNVYLRYSQAGKNHFEVFAEGDTFVHRKNISGIRWLTGQFSIDWCSPMSEKAKLDREKNFHCWMKKNNFEHTDKSLALGRIQVGRVTRETFSCRDLQVNHDILARYQNLHSIRLQTGSRSIHQIFPHTILHPNYEEIQYKQFLEDSFKDLRVWRT